MQLVRRDVERGAQHIESRDGLSGSEELQISLLSNQKLCLLDASQTQHGTDTALRTDPESIMLSDAQMDKRCFSCSPIGVKDILLKF
jgi:hypothetical protein